MGKMKYTCPWVRRNQAHTKSRVQISFEVSIFCVLNEQCRECTGLLCSLEVINVLDDISFFTIILSYISIYPSFLPKSMNELRSC